MDFIVAKPWILFWAFVIAGHLYLDYSLFRRWKGWSRGLSAGLTFSGLRRMQVLKIWFSEVFLQRQLLSLSAARWLIHQSIFWGFLALTFLSMSKFVLLLLSRISLDAGLFQFFSSGAGYPVTKLWGDLFGLMLFGGCAGALGRRMLLRPAQLVPDQTDMLLTVYLLFMTLSGFVLEGLGLSGVSADVRGYAFVGVLFSPEHLGIVQTQGAWHLWTWIVHAFSGAAILLYLPHSKLMHSLLAPAVIALNASDEENRKDMYWPRTKQYRPAK